MRSRKTAKILLNSVLECLESRLLFTSIEGTGTADHIIVSMSGTHVNWKFASDMSWTDLGTGIDTLTIDGNAGNDTIEIDSLDVNHLVVNGGDGSDTVEIDSLNADDATINGDNNNDTTYLNDVSGVTGTVYVNSFEPRPASGDWSGDDTSNGDALHIGDGNTSDFPDIVYDPGAPQTDDGMGNITLGDAYFSPITIDDHSDTNNDEWTIAQSSDVNGNNASGQVTLQVGASSRTFTDVSPFPYFAPDFVGLNIACGSGNDSITTDQDPLTGGPNAVSLTAGSGNDVLTANGGYDFYADMGDGNDTVTINALEGAAIHGGTGNDVFNFQDESTPTADTVIDGVQVLGDAGDDQFYIGSRNSTLYGIGGNTVFGGTGNDTLTVDDRNYDSTDSYGYVYTSHTDSYNDTGARYKVQSNDIYGAGYDSSWGNVTVYASDVDLVQLKMQSHNNTGSDVHPELVDFGDDLYTYPGEFDIYPGNVPVPSPGSGYDYNILNISYTQTSPSTSNSLHIVSSLGLDHVTIGDGTGGIAKVAIDGTAPLGSLTVNSDGELVVESDSSWTSLANPTINSGGIIDVESDVLTLDTAGQDIGALQIGATGKVVVDVGLDNAILMSSLSIASGGVLDMTNSEAVIDSGGSVSSWLTAIRSYLHGGEMITSSTSPSNTRVGYGSAATLSITGSWGGITLDPNSVLIKYTYGGDANLDGQVDIADLRMFAANWDLSSGAHWTDGDFNYDGTINVADLYIIALTWQDGVTGGGGDYSSWADAFANAFDNEYALVVGRYLFYNDSSLDGNDSTAGSSDDDAIDSNTTALLPGGDASTGQHDSGYSKGINGVMIDVQNLPSGVTLTSSDFTFKVGNSTDIGSWSSAPSPASITIRRGAGVDGSDRIEIIWADDSINNQWLQVTVKANSNTGLAAPDTFYFGNLAGDANGDGTVNTSDSVVTEFNTYISFSVTGSDLEYSDSFDIGDGDTVSADWSTDGFGPDGAWLIGSGESVDYYDSTFVPPGDAIGLPVDTTPGAGSYKFALGEDDNGATATLSATITTRGYRGSTGSGPAGFDFNVDGTSDSADDGIYGLNYGVTLANIQPAP